MSPRIVTTITPQRLSFAGGGTDIPNFYLQHGGAVLSTTIDKYIYVTVKRHSPLFNEQYRLSYSITEHVDSLELIKNDIARECLKLVPVEPPLFISTSADIPASSGLGSSSSFAVGLLYALHTMRGEEVSAGQLAEEACFIEISSLSRPIGKQDQYASAVGGLNFFKFESSDRVSIDHLWSLDNHIDHILDNSLLFWTGMQRDAGVILSYQQSSISSSIPELLKMRDLSYKTKDAFLSSGIDILSVVGGLLHEGWLLKRTLSNSISNSLIDSAYESALKAGAIGGKIAGAGGGGFLFLVAPKSRHQAIREALPTMNDVPISYEPRGSRILSSVA